MATDGKLLARARARQEEIREENRREQARRTALVYAKAPEIRDIDARLRGVMARLFGGALIGEADIPSLERESLELQMRRAELLTAHGYPVDYIDELYSCKKCRDAGYTDSGLCPCLMELYRAEQTKELSSLLKLGEERFAAFDLSLYSDAPDPETGRAPREVMRGILQFCREYAQDFEKTALSLLFRGGTGLGKTYLSACIARVAAERGFSVVYETAGDAMDAFETQKFARGTDEGDAGAERARRMLNCDLMILDDLGTEMTTSFSQSALYTLVNSRITAGKSTIVTTNLSSAELRKRYSPQTVSRLEGEYYVLSFAGRDIRAVKKERI